MTTMGSVANATSEGQLMQITKSFVSIILCVVITGCMSTAKKETPPELLELLNGLKVSYQIEEADIEYLQDRLDESRKTESNITSGQLIYLLSSRASVQALPRTERQALLRGSAYLLQHLELLDELRNEPGAIRFTFSEMLNGVTGHYYLNVTCTPLAGPAPPTYKKEWFAFSCPATNGTVCPFSTPATYTLYWCDD